MGSVGTDRWTPPAPLPFFRPFTARGGDAGDPAEWDAGVEDMSMGALGWSRTPEAGVPMSRRPSRGRRTVRSGIRITDRMQERNLLFLRTTNGSTQPFALHFLTCPHLSPPLF